MPKKTKSDKKMKRQDTLPLDEPEYEPKRVRTSSEESNEDKDERLKHFEEQRDVLTPIAAKLNPSGAVIDAFVVSKFKKGQNPKAPTSFKVLVLGDCDVEMQRPKEKVAEGEELVPEVVAPEMINVASLSVQYVKTFNDVDMEVGECVRLYGVQGQRYNDKISFVFRDTLAINDFNQNDLDLHGKLHLKDPFSYENNDPVLCPIMGAAIYKEEIKRVPCGMVGEIDVDALDTSYVFENKQKQCSIALNTKDGGFIIPVYQWNGRDMEKQRTIITRVYDSHLRSFGITDTYAWENLAPLILPYARGHLLGSVSANDTQRLTCNGKGEGKALFLWTNSIKWDVAATIKACAEEITQEELLDIYPDGNDFDGQAIFGLRDEICNLSECNWTSKRLQKMKPNAKFYKLSNKGSQIVYAI